MLKQSYTYFLLSAVLLLSSGAQASLLKLKESSVHAPGKLGRIELFHDDHEGFSLKQDGQFRKIEKHSVSPELRAISSLKLAKYQDAAYLTVQEQSDGELSLKSHVRGEAGGPFLAYAAYGLTKALIYGGACAGIGSVVVASGGAAGAALGATTAAATAGASTGATIVAGAIAGSGGTAATTCATATAMGVVHAGGLAGAMFAVETFSLFVGGLFACIPGPI